MQGRAAQVDVVRVARGVDAAALALAVRSPTWLDGATLLKQDGSSWVRRTTLAGRDVVVKARRRRTADRVKALVGQTRSQRQWTGSERLARHGIGGAEPIALLRAAAADEDWELLVYGFVPGPTLLEVVAGPTWLALGIRGQHAVAAAAGDSVASLHRAGLFNRDHKPSNLVIQGSSSPRVAILDAVAIHRGRSDSHVARMLASLVLEPTGVGLAPRLRGTVLFRGALAAAGGDRTRARILYRAAAAIARDHGDPTPEVNPLR